MRIREARFEDLVAITNIYNESVLNSTATFDIEPKTLKDRMNWFQARPKNLPLLVVEKNKQVVAWGALSLFSDKAGYLYTLEDSLYVRQDLRGQGVASSLLNELIKRAEDIGCHSIIAKIVDDNLPSIKLHAKYGFVQAGYLKEAGRKFDRWLNVVLMQKIID